MTWGISYAFPRAILHIDGDAFFASCEVAKDPSLRGKPVITGKERGIVSAATYEAKAQGVKTGMILSEARKLCPGAIILPSDYETYSIFSERMYAIVRRYTPVVEEYGIDECFADITGLRRLHHSSYEDIAKHIKVDLHRELNMTFSIGLGPTKVLAKLGSKWKKPDGFTAIALRDAPTYLAKTPVRAVWGIGPNTAEHLAKLGVHTALAFTQRSEGWVAHKLAKPYLELWRELRGETALEFVTEPKGSYHSISKTKTFTPATTNTTFIYSQLSKNVENACMKARRYNLAPATVFFFLKTQDFRYHGYEVKLSHPTNAPQDILRQLEDYFPRAYRQNVKYRATGIVLMKLGDASAVQLDLFAKVEKTQGLKRVFASIDQLAEKYGKHAVYLGSSFEAMHTGVHAGERGDRPMRTRALFAGETFRKRLAIPFIGEVS